MDIAVIGAGICGLTIANQLASYNTNITLFEKSRGPGGRTSTRRVTIPQGKFKDTEARINHGAQYFTVKDDIFAKQCQKWLKEGVIKPLEITPEVINPNEEAKLKENSHTTRYVFTPSMNNGCKALLTNAKDKIDFKPATRPSVAHNGNLKDENGQDLGSYDLIISTAPPLQVIDLFANYPKIIEPVKSINMLPNFTVMLTTDENITSKAAFVNNSKIGWLQNFSGLGKAASSIVIQSEKSYAMQVVENDKEQVMQELIAEYKSITGFEGQVTYSTIHRWLYAMVDETTNKHLKNRYILDAQNNIAIGGDWFTKSRIEDAYLNGYYLGQAIIQNYNL